MSIFNILSLTIQKEIFTVKKYKVCNFCKDIGEKYYDEDFILTPKPLNKNIPIGLLIKDFFTIDNEKIIKASYAVGIKKLMLFLDMLHQMLIKKKVV